jgi:hypothetical protein
MLALSFILPILLIILSKWAVPWLKKRVGDKGQTVYFIIAFVVIIVSWYLIDTRYGFHMGLW